MPMRFWFASMLSVAAYVLAWLFVLEPIGVDKSLYIVACLLIVFIGIRIYWRIGWGKWLHHMEYLWIPYFVVCAYFVVDWLR